MSHPSSPLDAMAANVEPYPGILEVAAQGRDLQGEFAVNTTLYQSTDWGTTMHIA